MRKQIILQYVCTAPWCPCLEIYNRSHLLFSLFRTPSKSPGRSDLTTNDPTWKDRGIMSFAAGSKLVNGEPRWPTEAKEGERDTAAKRRMGRSAMHQLLYFLNYGKPLHAVKHPEDSLLAFTCPALCCFRELVLLWDPMLKLLRWFLFLGGPYWAGYCDVATKITQ